MSEPHGAHTSHSSLSASPGPPPAPHPRATTSSPHLSAAASDHSGRVAHQRVLRRLADLHVLHTAQQRHECHLRPPGALKVGRHASEVDARAVQTELVLGPAVAGPAPGRLRVEGALLKLLAVVDLQTDCRWGGGGTWLEMQGA